MSATIYPPPQSPHANHSSPPRIGGIDATMTTQSLAAAPPKPNNGDGTPQHPGDHEKVPYRRLSHAEWVQFCKGIGVFKDDEGEAIVRPTSRWWPPKGFRDGLYQDTLTEKTKFTYFFYFVGVVTWILMLLQIAMSAVLTALGSVASTAKNGNGTAITSIAAVNTCVGGILALLHNSGLPSRYRSDRNEFYKLEEHMKAIVDTGLVPADQDINEALVGCYDMFRHARQTVQNNIPASYTPAPGKTPAPRVSKMTLEPKK